MKKLLYILVPLAGILVAVLAQYKPVQGNTRVNQHLEPDSEYTCSHQADEFCTKLPVVVLNTGDQEIAGMTDNGIRTSVDVSIYDKIGVNHLTDIPDVESYAEVKYRGNSSLFFDKKSYSIHLVKEDGSENNEKLMGMSKSSKWVLNGPYLDKTLIRNYMCMNIAGQIMDYAPNVRLCELFVDGNYQGVYVMMESVTRDNGRIDISGVDKRTSKTGFIVRLDRGGNEVNNLINFSKYARKIAPDSYFNIEYPGKKNLSPSVYDYIESTLTQFEKTLYSYDYDSEKYGYRNYINVDSFVQYFIINEFFMNIDAGAYSTYYYQDIGGKLNLCVWDFNNCCDNYMEIQMEENGFYMVDKAYFEMLVKDEQFVEQVIKTYRSLRTTVLSEEYLMKYIDGTVTYLGDAVDRNYEVWGYSFDPKNINYMNRLQPLERNLTSYEASIEQLKNYIIKRGNWLDKNIETLKQYSHESRTKKFDR